MFIGTSVGCVIRLNIHPADEDFLLTPHIYMLSHGWDHISCLSEIVILLGLRGLNFCCCNFVNDLLIYCSHCYCNSIATRNGYEI